MRLVLTPVISFCAFGLVLSSGDERPIREREVRGFDCSDQFGGHLLMRRVTTGKPPMRIFVLALRPDLARLVRVSFVRFDEEKAFARAARISDLDGQLLAARVSAIKLNRDLLFEGLEGERRESRTAQRL